MKLGDYLKSFIGKPATERPSLAVQGGGMRGVYSVAALAALEDAGLTKAFGRVGGSSAGAINAAYFLAGQANEGVSIYVDDLSASRFISFLRINKIVDIDYLVDVALRQHHPLDVAALRASDSELLTTMTSVSTGEGVLASSWDASLDAYEVMRATAALPGLYARQVQVGVDRYVDGGVVVPIPIPQVAPALEDAVFAIFTRPIGNRRHGRSPFTRRLASAVLRVPPPVAARMGAPDAEYNREVAQFEAVRARRSGVKWGVWPSDGKRLAKRTTMSYDKLRDCARMAKEDVFDLLEEDFELPVS
ncbi:MAG: patatin-like phospholipase family protein [Nocardioides sp.]|uniref:patatin-like phospholipase family protein n=1 Tax=Nocardioides sp. TaxID=35761 RepID=UPI0039E70DB1